MWQPDCPNPPALYVHNLTQVPQSPMSEPGAKLLEQQSNLIWAQRLKLLCLLLLGGQLIGKMEILLSELSGQRICPVFGKKRKERKEKLHR